MKWVIPPLALRTESNDVEWKRFIEALSPPLTPSLSLSDSSSISSSLSPSSSVSPSLCFYGGIIISLSRPLLLRLEQNNKFQDHADAALLHLKLILWTRQKVCTETHKTTKIVAYSCSAYFLNINNFFLFFSRRSRIIWWICCAAVVIVVVGTSPITYLK